MNDLPSVVRTIIVVGVAIVILGAVILLFSRLSGGRGAPLPGDIVIKRDHVTIYFPIISSIVISIVLTLILWLIAALRK